MIYVMGMSHADCVLQAASTVRLTHSPDDWLALTQAKQFYDVATKPGLFPENRIKALVVFPGIGHAVIQHFANGQRQILATEGYLALLQTLEAQQDGNVMFSFIGGNEHSMLSMLQHPVPYDFFLPGHDAQALADGAQPVPYEIIRAQLEKELNHTVAMLLMIRLKLPRLRLVHVMPPPPVASTEQIMRGPEVFGERVKTLGISPIALRVKYYVLACEVLRNALAPYQIETLEVPSQTVDANGAIKTEYGYMATHANDDYGRIVCEQMRALVLAKAA